jgi:hypothetical protein
MKKYIKFWIRCITAVWQERSAKPCRQKLKRLERKFVDFAKELGV